MKNLRIQPSKSSPGQEGNGARVSTGRGRMELNQPNPLIPTHVLPATPVHNRLFTSRGNLTELVPGVESGWIGSGLSMQGAASFDVRILTESRNVNGEARSRASDGQPHSQETIMPPKHVWTQTTPAASFAMTLKPELSYQNTQCCPRILLLHINI